MIPLFLIRPKDFCRGKANKPMSSKDRVLIAQDVLKWLRNGKIIATHMTYVTWDTGPSIKIDQELSVQLKEAPPCNVCAKGAAFIVAVDRYNEIKAREVVDIDHEANMGMLKIEGEGLENFLLKFWDRKQINQIEAAFEGWGENQQNDEQYAGYTSLYELYDFSCAPMQKEHADVRLAMIMRNVIAHDGEFNVEDFLEEMMTLGYDHSVLELPPKAGV